MFTTLGLFAGVPCPESESCPLLTCMFSHQPKPLPPHNSPSTRMPVSKKPKLQNTALTSSEPASSPRARPPMQGPLPATMASTIAEAPPAISWDEPTPSSTTRKASARPTSHSKPGPATSGASRGTILATPACETAQRPPPRVRKEPLNPRMLSKSPANHSVRSAILDKLFSAMQSLNDKLAQDKACNQWLVLNRDELVTMALDEEETVAKDNASLYSNLIKLRIVKLTKMTTEEWTKEVDAHLTTRHNKLNPPQTSTVPSVPPAPPKKTHKSIDTGLTASEEIAVVSQLVTPLNGLEEFGYVTRAPTESDTEIAGKGVAESKGWEKCDRCGGRFQVFPGRREDGALASGGECTYHPSRPTYPRRKRTDNATGSSDAYFPCCSESLGTSPGCTKSATHVFKVTEPKRLASILQFISTPAQPDRASLQPVCMDCEMGYTTLGLEMIRLTAISWPEGHDLLDVLVKPMGEVLDLNSRFSGVFPEHYASAVPYGTTVPDTNATGKEKPLQVVQSPAAARDLLFGLLQPDTPLIGHAIDNDLNVCRVIHPTVIDTVVLYPHPRGRLPYRMGLKALARKFLERDIQTGDRGHDSKEDSLATGDLVRVKVGEKWMRLKSKGWRLENDTLLPPPIQQSQDDPQAVSKIGLRGGQKRKNSNPDCDISDSFW